MATDDLKIQLRLPRDLHAQLVASAAAQVRSLNGEIVAAIRRGHDATEQTDDADQRFIVRRIDAPLPWITLDRTYQFGASSFGTREEALAIAEEWNERYSQAPEPQPARVG